jgi:hypothetical protein
LADTQPPISFNCRQAGRDLNVSTTLWGCTNAPAVLGTSDQTCGDPANGSQLTEWFGRTSPFGCRWQISNQQVDDSSQFLITWNQAQGLADMGVDPIFTFAAILSNPPPSLVEVSLASLTNGVSTRCLVAVPLVFSGAQPQTFTASFTSSNCPPGFDSRRVSRFTMAVLGPVVPGPSVSFQLVSSSAPLPGPCFNGTSGPISTTATTTGAPLTTTPAPGVCLNLTAPCNNATVQTFSTNGQYCFPMFGPPTSPMLAIAIVCNGSSLTTLTCPTLDCSSGCVPESGVGTNVGVDCCECFWGWRMCDNTRGGSRLAQSKSISVRSWTMRRNDFGGSFHNLTGHNDFPCNHQLVVFDDRAWWNHAGAE